MTCAMTTVTSGGHCITNIDNTYHPASDREYYHTINIKTKRNSMNINCYSDGKDSCDCSNSTNCYSSNHFAGSPTFHRKHVDSHRIHTHNNQHHQHDMIHGYDKNGNINENRNSNDAQAAADNANESSARVISRSPHSTFKSVHHQNKYLQQQRIQRQLHLLPLLFRTIFFLAAVLWIISCLCMLYLANYSIIINHNDKSSSDTSSTNNDTNKTYSLSQWFLLLPLRWILVEPTTLTYQQLKEEDPYVLLFYLLLILNLIVMLLPYCSILFTKIKMAEGSVNHVPVNASTSFGGADAASDRVSFFRRKGERQHPNYTSHNANIDLQHSAHALQHQHLHQQLFYQTYLPAYLLATAADWLQGPYKYALYSSYGYSQTDIAHLFVVGYGSGMLLGSLLGGMADKLGRKKLCLCYCLFYSMSVLCTHSRSYGVLMLGRVGGGIGTSLLFSVFEAWLIRAYAKRGPLLLSNRSNRSNWKENRRDCKREEEEKERWLAKSFSISMYGSSLVAIASGVLANAVVGRSGKIRVWHVIMGLDVYVGGYLAAFDVCLPILLCCAVMIMLQWEENYGEGEEKMPSAVFGSNQSIHSNNSINCEVGYRKKHSSIHSLDNYVDVSANGENGNFFDDVTLQSSPLHNFEEIASDNQKNNQQHVSCGTFWNSMCTVWQSPEILLCCIIGSFFEGAMYIFIFLWTPALTSIQQMIYHHQRTMLHLQHFNDTTETEITSINEETDDVLLPFGWIFSTFMVCCMLGTSTFSYLSQKGVSASHSLVWILFLSSLSSVAMAVPYTITTITMTNDNSDISGASSFSGAYSIQYFGMLLYEFSIGAYYPAMGTIKGTLVPESQRAAIYNVFRLPLNLFVLLYLVGDFSTRSSFLANGMMLLVACGLQLRLVRGWP